jgi:CBS domain-containing protein
MHFDDAKDNFFAAARHGLRAQLAWVDGKHYASPDLVKKYLLPLAAQGLREARINAEDIDRYLEVIEGRLEAAQTGSQWTLSAAAFLSSPVRGELRDQRLVAGMLARQKSGQPVHAWQRISKEEAEDLASTPETVGEIMSTDLFTVTPDDPITVAASMMDWRHIRHLPVEDNGRLAGLVSSRDVLHLLASRARIEGESSPVSVRAIMNAKPVTVTRETPLTDALQLMVQDHVDCLPVTEGDELIGIITSRDMLEVLSSLLTRRTPATVVDAEA